MKRIALLLLVVAVVAGVAAARAQTSFRTEVTSAARSAKEVRGASPYLEIKNEPAPKLIVDPHFPTCWIRALSGESAEWAGVL
jgi:hypothetical protein